MKVFKNHLLDNILSFFFILIGSEILFYSIYRRFNILYSIIIGVLVLGYFCLYKLVVDWKRRGIFLYLVAGILSIGITYFLVSVSDLMVEETFYQWAFGGGGVIGDYLGYIYGAIIFISFAFSSLGYYFTVNIFRRPMVFLMSLIVLVSYIKGVYIQRTLFTNIIVFLFIILIISLFIEGTKKDGLSIDKIINIKKKDYFKVMVAFCGLIFLIAYFLPLPARLPQNDFLDNVRRITNLYMGTSNISGFNIKGNSIREVNQSTGINSNNIVYTVQGEDVRYLIDHSFDKFENGMWKYETEDFKEGELITYKYKKYEIDSGIYFLERAGKENKDYENLIKERDNKLYRKLWIQINDSDSYFLSHPSNTSSVNISSLDEKVIHLYLNSFEQLFFDDKKVFRNGEVYNIEYINDEPSENTIEEALMKYMNLDRFNELLRAGGENNRCKYNDLIDEVYLNIEDDVTDRMKNLANELTKDKESNYDKAASIRDFFLSGEYVYSLELPVNREKGSYIDYFIFAGKEGYCVQYATAMTLLCRSSGIPARYVEGYLVTEKDENGNYVVRESNGHAFVQVFIPGYGWKIFDPTPSSEGGEVDIIEENNEKSGGSLSGLMVSFTLFMLGVLFIIFIVWLIYLILYLTKRNRFLYRIKKYTKEETFEALIKECIELLEKVDIEPYLGETELIFAQRVESNIDVGFLNLMKSYYEYKYAFKEVSKKDLQEAYRVNKEIYNYIKR